MSYSSDASTICGGECHCIGYGDHSCGTLNCGRCGKDHSKIICVSIEDMVFAFRLVEDKVCGMLSDDLYGSAFREQQMVWLENITPFSEGLYYFE
jgi:hypothetical protein